MVICAHVAPVQGEAASAVYAGHILSNLGSVGVGIFYFISGYCFHPAKYSFGEMARKKARQIILPWWITGTLVWLYQVVRKGGANLSGYAKFLLGNGSYLYFLTNLLLYFLVFYWIGKRGKAVLPLCILAAGISYGGLVAQVHGWNSFSTPYLNPFNFLLYFAVGFLLGQKKKEGVFPSWLKRILPLALLLPLSPMTFSYWENELTPLWEFLFIFATLSLACICPLLLKQWMMRLGKQSFAFYLLHMPFAGVVVNLCNRFSAAQHFTLLRPVMVCLAVGAGIWILKILSKRCNVNWVPPLLGIRME